ncbi:MAG: glycosyltransferase [Sarcina sp.]
MKVLADGLNYFLHKGEYGENTRNTLNALSKLNGVDIHITQDKFISNYPKNSLNSIIVNVDRLSDDYKFDTRKSFDIFHCFNNGFYINNNIKAKRVFSVTTLLPLLDENLCSIRYKGRFMKRIEDGVNFSHSIIVTSNFQKDLLLRYFKKSLNKISVLYPSIPQTYNTDNISTSKLYLKSKFLIDSKYILFCGDLHRKKNIEDILFFYKTLKDKINTSYKLVIAITFIHKNSYESDYIGELKSLSYMLNIADSILFIEDPNEIDMIHLFKAANKYVDFSITDDFNLAIIKAFVCDIDIICTKTRLHKELLGDYPSFYEFDEDMIVSLFRKFKSEEDKEKFDYLKDNFRGDYSYKEILNIYSNLKR